MYAGGRQDLRGGPLYERRGRHGLFSPVDRGPRRAGGKLASPPLHGCRDTLRRPRQAFPPPRTRKVRREAIEEEDVQVV